MNTDQQAEIDEFVKSALQAAIDELNYLQRLMRQQVASAPCVILRLETAIQLMGEE